MCPTEERISLRYQRATISLATHRCTQEPQQPAPNGNCPWLKGTGTGFQEKRCAGGNGAFRRRRKPFVLWRNAAAAEHPGKLFIWRIHDQKTSWSHSSHACCFCPRWLQVKPPYFNLNVINVLSNEFKVEHKYQHSGSQFPIIQQSITKNINIHEWLHLIIDNITTGVSLEGVCVGVCFNCFLKVCSCVME